MSLLESIGSYQILTHNPSAPVSFGFYYCLLLYESFQFSVFEITMDWSKDLIWEPFNHAILLEEKKKPTQKPKIPHNFISAWLMDFINIHFVLLFTIVGLIEKYRKS